MFEGRGETLPGHTQQAAQWAPGAGLSVAMLFWDCQCGHLFSGHVEKGISERGYKLRCFQTLLCSSTSLSWERGAFKENS